MNFPVQHDELTTLQYLIANYFPTKDAAQAQAVLSRLVTAAAIEAQGVPEELRNALQQIADWNSHSLQLAVEHGAVGVRDFYRQIALDALASAPPEPQAIPPELDVRTILLAIEPGADCTIEEIYAKSVADVEAKLTAMDQELEEWQLGIKRLPAPQEPIDDNSHSDLEYSPEGPGVDGFAPQASVVQQEPALTTCNCRWNGLTQVQQCALHEAHIDAAHEWAERAKTAETKLSAQQAKPQPLSDEQKDAVLSDVVDMLSKQHDWLTRTSVINLVAGLYGRAGSVLARDGP